MTTITTNTKSKNADELANLVGPIDKARDNQAREALMSSRIALLMQHPFFGNMATRLSLINADEWLSTAATDGRNFYYNSKFVNMLAPEEVDFLVGHEILHVVYDHIGRRDDRNPQLWNIADDYCVNSDLKKHNVGRFITTVPCLYDAKYDGWSAEEVYEDLYKNADKINIESLVDKLLDDHLDGDGDVDAGDGDNKSKGKRPDPLSESERDQLRQEIQDSIINAARAAKEAGGSVPDTVARMIKEITEPQMPWRDLIQTVLTSTIKTDYTFMRPSRRGWHLDAVMPSQNPGEEIDIVVAIDTSGSISSGELSLFLGEVQGIMDSFDGYKIKVISWDTRVSNPKDYTSENLENISEYVPAGGGGTSPECIFEWLKHEGIVPDRLVVFTDGYFYGGDGPKDYCDVAWIIKGNPEFKASHGTWAHFKD